MSSKKAKYVELDGTTPSRGREPEAGGSGDHIGGRRKSVCGRMSSKKKIALAVTLALAVVLIVTVTLLAVYLSNDKENLTDSVELDKLVKHLSGLQDIADTHGGVRATSTTGYTASVEYVVDQLADSGLTVSLQDFSFDLFVTNASHLAEIQPTARTYTTVDYGVFTNSPTGSGNAPVIVIPNVGCDTADYSKFVAGSVALVSRGTCTFSAKTQLAITNGAVCIIIYNLETEAGPISGTVDSSTIPVFSLSYARGYQLSLEPNATIQFSVTSNYVTVYSQNVLAETTKGNPNSTIVVGAHLDSDAAGPGINDNGSGVACLIEMARLLKSTSLYDKMKNKLVFAWWGAEEDGLQGSDFYVKNRNEYPYNIAANINLDMLGSPNYANRIHNGTSCSSDVQLQKGCIYIQTLFSSYLEQNGEQYVLHAFSSSSDYDAFLVAGIPSNGIEAGAGQLKTVEERSMFGGLAQTAYDTCYHTSCDTEENVNQDALLSLSKATAHVVEELASTVDLLSVL
ncbi:M28 family peptidase [Pelomyxa schiedti]|nr:M28 family peptidase [Pelomyxa schiedti]